MKKRLALALAVASISATATVAMAGWTAGTGINGSLHDINIVGGGYKADIQGRTCVFCHTPHNAQKADANVPLWNHKLTALPRMPSYQWIAPANKNSEVAISEDPLIGPSRLCMACHDGDTAVDAHGTAGSENNGGNAMKAGIGYKAEYTDALGNTVRRYIKDLTVTHPIGFDYDAIQQKRGISEIIPKTSGFIKNRIAEDNSAANWDTKYGSTSRQTAGWTEKKIEDTLYGGNIMTCASCHDVHNTLNVTDDNKTYNYFLYARQEGSAICLSCHVK